MIESLERTHVGLKGPVTTPIGGGFPSVNVALRKHFDLYANVRPVHSLPGLKTRFDDVTIDMVIFRENTEDLYSGLEHEVVKDVVTSLKVITRTASIRIAEYAFAVRQESRPQEGDRDPQGQHHEAGRRPVPALLPRSGRSDFRRSNTRS